MDLSIINNKNVSLYFLFFHPWWYGAVCVWLEVYSVFILGVCAMFRRACVNTGAIFPSRKITLNFSSFLVEANKKKKKKTKQKQKKKHGRKNPHMKCRERQGQPKKQGSAACVCVCVFICVCVVPYTHTYALRVQTHPLGPQGPFFFFFFSFFLWRWFRESGVWRARLRVLDTITLVTLVGVHSDGSSGVAMSAQ